MSNRFEAFKLKQKFLTATPEQAQVLYDQNFKKGIHAKDFHVGEMYITEELREKGLQRHADDDYLETRGGFPVQGQPQATTGKQEMISITIIDSEGQINWKPQTFTTWAACDEALKELHVSNEGRTPKTDFSITYQDGEKYNGTIVLRKDCHSLGQQMKDYTEFHLGPKPGYVSEEVWESKKPPIIEFMSNYELAPLATAIEAQPQKPGQGTEAEPPNNTSLLSQIAGANLKEASLRYDETKKRKFKDGYEAIFNYIKRNGTGYPDKNAPGDYLFYRHNAKGKRVVIRQDWNDTTWLTEYAKGDEWKNRVTFSLENTPEHVNNLWQMFNALASI